MRSPRFPHGLMFHRFRREGSAPAGQGSVTPAEFENILCLAGTGNMLSPEEWLFRLDKNRLRRNDLCVTFDDGLKCQFDIALPVLERHGLKAFWFIYSSVFEGGMNRSEVYNYFAANYFDDIDEFFNLFFGRCGSAVMGHLRGRKFKSYSSHMSATRPFYSAGDLKFRFIRNEVLSKERFENIVDGIMAEKGASVNGIAKKLWMTNSELKSLSERGHHVGLHSYDHPVQLAKLPRRQQAEQYERNHEHIKRVCGRKAVAMSHPLNSYDSGTLKILKGLGVKCGFRADTATPAGGRINPTRLEMAREDSAKILIFRGGRCDRLCA